MKSLRNMTEPELKDLLNTMGDGITAIAAKLQVEKPHFALLLFNDPEIAQYVCNCERADVIKAMRETADRLEGRDTLERVPFGATGDFPDGSIHENDEGGIVFGIAADPMNQAVIVDFGKPVRSLGMGPAEARRIAASLNQKANQLDGGIGV